MESVGECKVQLLLHLSQAVMLIKKVSLSQSNRISTRENQKTVKISVAMVIVTVTMKTVHPPLLTGLPSR